MTLLVSDESLVENNKNKDN
jgi:hypothetical protein